MKPAVKLADTQALFWRAVREDRPPRELREVFTASAGADVVARAQIYRHAYWARHDKCLVETYPRLHAALGPSAFRALVRDYIEAHPSTFDAIERAGHALPAHLAANPQRYAPWLADVAALEWARLHAILAPSSPHPAPRSALHAPDAPARRLCLRPDLSALQLGPRALAWLGIAAAPPTLDAQVPAVNGAAAPLPSAARAWTAVWRGPNGPAECPLSPAQGAALSALLGGASLAHACTAFDTPGPAAEALAIFCDRGWVLGLERKR